MKSITHIVGGAICLLLTVHPTSGDAKTFVENWLQEVALCEMTPENASNDSDGIQMDIDDRLVKYGISITDNLERTGETNYKFPIKTRLLGYPAIDAISSFESVTTFLVRLNAGRTELPHIKNKLNLQKISKANKEGYGYFDYMEVMYIKKLHQPGDDGRPNTIISGINTESGRDYVVVGCQNLAW